MARTGNPGNVTVKRETSPPLFYIHNGQLWHYHNGTTILPVAVRNSTASAALPLQLSVGKGSRDAVRGGSWRWQGTMLYYEQGSASNSGAYYSCQDTNGLMGLFTFLRPCVSLTTLASCHATDLVLCSDLQHHQGVRSSLCTVSPAIRPSVPHLTSLKM